jgi:hypothetical protein
VAGAVGGGAASVDGVPAADSDLCPRLHNTIAMAVLHLAQTFSALSLGVEVLLVVAATGLGNLTEFF